MAKEIHEQPQAIASTLQGRTANGKVLEACLGVKASELLDKVQRVRIVACGTSAHAGMVAKYWFESIAKTPCQVELASEFRYRTPLVEADTLFITISQSGETADTLEALRHAKTQGIAASLVICNAPESSLVRESDIALMTHAGPERSVASTKAFTTQLAALALVMLLFARRKGLSSEDEAMYIRQLESLPGLIEDVLEHVEPYEKMAEAFRHKKHALFLGRGAMYPVAMEGALKLKEITYIHAESYAAGELKHGPLALVDETMPIVVVAPSDDLIQKVRSNVAEVAARKGEVFVLADQAVHFRAKDDKGQDIALNIHNTLLPEVPALIAPMFYTVPLQLLAYYTALLKGTDIDQPRNLAKSVTVE
jgi:glucosamine--fructose-6-phosphate aminotransferase (isomerizing)